ncbi:RNA polymerase sigma factor [Sphingomonas sp.]|uniref:RNA polymerase sigma factor n=1 Tax=Sphingomonas sp. TaxID=28214 RepID=UPI002DD622AA|nr:sigma-70 family RNA polymerase sigma factor [Sphingomonas sp.]
MKPERNDVLVTALHQRFRPALMSFFLRRMRDVTEAEDLTQEVLLRVSEHAATIDPSRPDAYVFQIAANMLRDRARRTRVRSAYQAEASALRTGWIDELDPDRVMQGRQSLNAVLAALRDLPERTRTIFVLFRLEHMKQREIATMLGISIRTVEQHVIRASVSLKRSLASEESPQ